MKYTNQRGNPRRSSHDQGLGKIDSIIIDIQKKLRDEIKPINIPDLSAFERKKIHSFFDNKSDYITKTYREENDYIFRVYPIANLKRFVEAKAKEALSTGNSVELPAMTSYERFIVHDFLKSWDGIETASSGEDQNRHIEIRPKKFGRTLKRIIKKIKIF